MQKWIEKYNSYFEPKAVKVIKKCLFISGLTCSLGIFLLGTYHFFYISHLLYDASLIIFRTGIMIGLFPGAFVLVIGKWKNEH